MAARTLRRGVEMVRLPPSALQPPNPAAYVHKKAAGRYMCDLFALQLYPLQGLAVGPHTRTMPKAIGPSWLPWPPTEATHGAHHVRLANAAFAAANNPQAPRERFLRTTVFVSKKRVHKLAVVRNRCRTRLTGALRALLAREDMPVRDRTSPSHQCTSMYF